MKSNKIFLFITATIVLFSINTKLVFGLNTSQPIKKTMLEVFQNTETDNFISMMNKIIELEKQGFSPKEIILIMDESPLLSENIHQPFPNLSIGDTINTGYSEWSKLTRSEKWLIVMNPLKAIETYKISQLAFQYTEREFGHNGLGDKSDAFRHALWNALLCKNIDTQWAEEITTAHEDKNEEQLNQIAPDGNPERAHRFMDLHNNNEGRTCWYREDTESSTSDETLIQRVHLKLNSGKLMVLNI